MRLSLIEVVGTEPLTAAELATQLRIDPDGLGFYEEEDTFLRQVKAARELFEDETGRQVLEATWQVLLPGFPRRRRDAVEIPRPPLIDVTAIQYLDAGGTLQTWDPEEWEAVKPAGTFARPGWIQPAANESYPLARRQPGSVRITFRAGYEDNDYPESLRETLLHIAVGLYEFREPQVVGSIVNSSPSFDRLIARWQLPVMA
jgi:uncharacterized phiE125 gp8 family phage protein